MNEFRDTHASMLKFCRDFADQMNTTGQDIEVVDFDAATNPQMWPQKDVIGLAEFDLTLDDGNILVTAVIAVSTVEDTNNFRLYDFLNVLVNKLIPGGRVTLYNASNSQVRGFLSIRNGTSVASPVKTKTRTVQPVMVSLISDQTLRG